MTLLPPPAKRAPTADRPLCAQPLVPERPLPVGLDPARERLIRYLDKKWVNGTVLHYYFFDRDTDGRQVRFSDGSSRFVPWKGADAQVQAVMNAFDTWRGLGIGVRFARVTRREEAELRIAFEEHDGSWSNVGRDNVDLAHLANPNERTMNFGWDLTTEYGRDTALHEIGHALGFPHEHQNPNAGIEWDEDEVYRWAERTQGWDRDTTFRNILRKLPTDTIEGSLWDPNSIMHYGFPAGLIRVPERYQREPLRPEPDLSPIDKQEVLALYPSMDEAQERVLEPFVSHRLELSPGQQADFVIRPSETRKHTIQTFGPSDAVMVLFEERNGEPRFLAADDDSGTSLNAKIDARLTLGSTYRLRIRLYSAQSSGGLAVMMW